MKVDTRESRRYNPPSNLKDAICDDHNQIFGSKFKVTWFLLMKIIKKYNSNVCYGYEKIVCLWEIECKINAYPNVTEVPLFRSWKFAKMIFVKFDINTSCWSMSSWYHESPKYAITGSRNKIETLKKSTCRLNTLSKRIFIVKTEFLILPNNECSKMNIPNKQFQAQGSKFTFY